MSIPRLTLALTALFLCHTSTSAEEPPVKVENGWVRAGPASLSDTAAFMVLMNNGDQPLRLTGGRTDVGGMVMPMITTREMKGDAEVMGMKGVDALVIPAHGKLVLAPGGNHLMMMGLKEHPEAGGKVTLTLQLEPGHRELTVELPVALTKP